ncbi:hypothetical protein BGZ76_006560 [Entomortierella beljakovae]|nr:hypothetical protein BGZ76_006560 [Entomortierella beljakovae]
MVPAQGVMVLAEVGLFAIPLNLNAIGNFQTSLPVLEWYKIDDNVAVADQPMGSQEEILENTGCAKDQEIPGLRTVVQTKHFDAWQPKFPFDTTPKL